MSGVGSARGPDCPIPERSRARGFALIPVSVAGEGVQVEGGPEQNKGLVIPGRDMACGRNAFGECAQVSFCTCILSDKCGHN